MVRINIWVGFGKFPLINIFLILIIYIYLFIYIYHDIEDI